MYYSRNIITQNFRSTHVWNAVAYLLTAGRIGRWPPFWDFLNIFGDGPTFWEMIIYEKIIGDLGARSRYIESKEGLL